jgi:hypothetical protein
LNGDNRFYEEARWQVFLDGFLQNVEFEGLLETGFDGHGRAFYWLIMSYLKTLGRR